MLKSMVLLLKLTVTFATTFYMIEDAQIAQANSTNQSIQSPSHTYTLNLKSFHVSNTGSNPIETTKGINAALKWAHDNGYTTFKLPEGTYLIDKNNPINMVGNMTFSLDSKTICNRQVELNSFRKIILNSFQQLRLNS